MTATAVRLRYEDIAVGAVVEFSRTITAEDVVRFVELTGDMNPLHVDDAFGARSAFGQRVVHGMLLAGLFSTLIGMHCPGERALYLSQTLAFRKPAFIGDAVRVRGIVTAKSDATRVITLRTEVLRGEDILVTGEARAQVLT